MLRVCGGQVYFIYYGNKLKIMIKSKIGVGKGLRLNTLRSVNDQQRTLARGKRARNFIIEVNMTRSVNEIEFICFSVFGFVIKLDGVGFNGNSSFALKIHVVEQLLGHVPFCNGIGKLQQSVGKG